MQRTFKFLHHRKKKKKILDLFGVLLINKIFIHPTFFLKGKYFWPNKNFVNPTTLIILLFISFNIIF